jgi:hypothetical protein
MPIAEPILGSLEQLLILLFFALMAAASSWLTKRREEAVQREAERTRAARAGQPGQTLQERRSVPSEEPEETLNAEEILRRLLGGEPAPSEEPPPKPPMAAPRPAPSPEPVRSPPPARREPPPPPQWATSPAPPPLSVPERALAEPALPLLQPSLQTAPRLPASSPTIAPSAHRPTHAARDRLIRTLRSPASARHAFLVAQVFGPPKGLDPRS